jgi:hypothetical protein
MLKVKVISEGFSVPGILMFRLTADGCSVALWVKADMNDVGSQFVAQLNNSFRHL